MSARRIRLPAWTGLAAGAAAFAVSTQLNYALVPAACAGGVNPTGPLALLLALAAAGGGLASLRVWRSGGAVDMAEHHRSAAPHRFLAGLSALIAAFFALLILMQGGAALVFDGCER